MTQRIPIYLAHCLNAPTRAEIDRNRTRAARWACWLARRYLVSPVADWIVLSSQWDESPENRALGLECDRALVELVGTVIAVGPRMSEGMKFEASWAKMVVDLTGIYDDCDEVGPCRYSIGNTAADGLAEIKQRMAAAGFARVAP